MTTDNHAQEQAIAQANSIAAMVGALNVDYDRLEELRDELESLEADFKEAEEELKKNDHDAEHGGWAEVPSGTDEASAKAAMFDAQKALAEWRVEYAEELKELEEAANGNDDAEEARERIQEDPLSVHVREDWKNPGEESTPGEFQILLCTGGPAVRIMGELDDNMQPCRAWIEYQDWGTPWTHASGIIEQSTLLEYCQQFYFGE
jgi:hypothetical protein